MSDWACRTWDIPHRLLLALYCSSSTLVCNLPSSSTLIASLRGKKMISSPRFNVWPCQTMVARIRSPKCTDPYCSFSWKDYANCLERGHVLWFICFCTAVDVWAVISIGSTPLCSRKLHCDMRGTLFPVNSRASVQRFSVPRCWERDVFFFVSCTLLLFSFSPTSVFMFIFALIKR